MPATYALKHIETRWLSMKNVCVRILEQWVKLKEYFLRFLPNNQTLRQVSVTARHNHIKEG